MKKKKSLLIYSFMLMGISIVLFTGCSNDNNNISTDVQDADGNVYHTVTIGTQVWMVENLKTTKLNDGTSITPVTNGTTWSTLTTPAYAQYNNQSTNMSTYGAMYNWYAVNTGKLAPKGWHVPSDAEWTTLITFLGGESVAGGKLKEAGTAHWTSPNTGATNSSGFTALPGGSRYTNGGFYIMGTYGFWWSSTESTTTAALHRYMSNVSSSISTVAGAMSMGFSVRCVKD